MATRIRPKTSLKYMLRHMGEWPFYPYLPVKRVDRSGRVRELGVIIARHRRSVFDYVVRNAVPTATSLKTQYESVEDMIRDGWMPD